MGEKGEGRMLYEDMVPDSVSKVKVPLFIARCLKTHMQVIHVSEGMCKFIGQGARETKAFLEKPLSEHVHPDDVERVRRALQTCCANPGKYQQISYRFRVPAAKGYTWLMSGIEAQVQAGIGPLLSVNCVHVTCGHNVSEEISHSHHHLNPLLEKILDTTQTALFWKDSERRFLGANKAFLDYYGFPSETVLIGKTDEEMGWHDDDAPFRNDEAWVLQTGNSTCRVHGRCRSHGQMRDILASKSPIIENGKIVGLVGSFEDVTDEYQQRQRIMELNNELHENIKKIEHADAVKMEFMSNVSHDMRTPLNGILGFVELAQQCADDPQRVQEYIAKIKQSGEFLLDLVNDTLDISRLASDKVKVDYDTVPAQHIFDNLLTTVKAVAQKAGVEFRVDIDLQELGLVRVDVLKICKIMLNFLSNSVKFTPQGGLVTFKAQVLPEREGHRRKCRFIVSDTGVGMSEEFQPRMFNPFEQEHAMSQTGAMGTGLGLSIAKRLVDVMGGTIAVKSKVNEGTVITTDLFLEQAEGHMAEPETSAESEASLAGHRILVCEDNPLNLEIVSSLLKLKKLDVVAASNGRQGVQVFEQSAPGSIDAILMDVRMPVMDGLEATRAIRSLPRADAQAVPIVALSANAFKEDKAKSKAAGMNAHLTKPLVMQDLVRTLSHLIGIYDEQRRANQDKGGKEQP